MELVGFVELVEFQAVRPAHCRPFSFDFPGCAANGKSCHPIHDTYEHLRSTVLFECDRRRVGVSAAKSRLQWNPDLGRALRQGQQGWVHDCLGVQSGRSDTDVAVHGKSVVGTLRDDQREGRRTDSRMHVTRLMSVESIGSIRSLFNSRCLSRVPTFLPAKSPSSVFQSCRLSDHPGDGCLRQHDIVSRFHSRPMLSGFYVLPGMSEDIRRCKAGSTCRRPATFNSVGDRDEPWRTDSFACYGSVDFAPGTVKRHTL